MLIEKKGKHIENQLKFNIKEYSFKMLHEDLLESWRTQFQH
jgi:hypothetical protein